VAGSREAAKVIESGAAVLRRILSERLLDLRELDVNQFRGWLEQHLTNWSRDPVFIQRSRIRDLRRAHPELRELEEERRHARLQYEASALFAELEGVYRELAGANNAVAGLTHALRSADEIAERQRPRLKRDHFGQLAEELQRQVLNLTKRSEERATLDRVENALERVREQVGFKREVALLEGLQRKHGRSSGRSGVAFEVAASEATRLVLLPELANGSAAPLTVLHGVKLGAARTEIDQLVIRMVDGADEPVEVVALIEAKRNPNDLAHGLRRRLENLTWLAGYREGYDAGVYRTRSSPSGHFDGAAMHREGGEGYRFTRESFGRFYSDLSTGALPRYVYLITRSSYLWGIGCSGLGRIAHRISSDVGWNPGDGDYLATLLRWCQGLTEEIEAPDLIRRYAADAEASRRVLLLGD
jgi:hypothetical protein